MFIIINIYNKLYKKIEFYYITNKIICKLFERKF